MSKDVTDALLPCPFCGSARIVMVDHRDWYHVFCECQVEGPPSKIEAEAIAAWNRRAPATCPVPCETCRKFALDCILGAQRDGAMNERAAIVAWLRTPLGERGMPGCPPWIARAIERGEHLPAKSAVKEPAP